MKPVTVHRPSSRLIAVVLLAATAGSAGGAVAQGRGQRDQGDRTGQERHADHRALADAVRRVERATGGEVLSAERVQSDGRDVSRVKVVDASGRVRVYMGDPPPRERKKDDRTRGNDSNKD